MAVLDILLLQITDKSKPNLTSPNLISIPYPNPAAWGNHPQPLP